MAGNRERLVLTFRRSRHVEGVYVGPDLLRAFRGELNLDLDVRPLGEAAWGVRRRASMGMSDEPCIRLVTVPSRPRQAGLDLDSSESFLLP